MNAGLLTIDQAAQHFGGCKITVRDLIAKGKLDYLQVGSVIRIFPESLRKLRTPVSRRSTDQKIHRLKAGEGRI